MDRREIVWSKGIGYKRIMGEFGIWMVGLVDEFKMDVQRHQSIEFKI